MPSLGGAPPCMVCQKRVYFNEQKLFMQRAWHSTCFKCTMCSKRLESGTANLDDEKAYCNTCIRKLGADAKENVAPREVYINKEDPECCPRCGKRVYFAEQMMNLGRKWHNTCFTCAFCNKKVETVNVCDHDGELYCRACYGRHFGPKGYGFAGGSGMGLSMEAGSDGVITDNVPKTAQAYMVPVTDSMKDMNLEGENGTNGSSPRPRVDGGEYCPRCDKQVFIAEKRQAAGNAYHARCFTCLECKVKLEAGKISEREGEVYCRNCYGKNFGPKGYGFSCGAGNVLSA